MLELKGQTACWNKKILQGAQKNYNSVVQENKELRKYIENIKERYQQYQEQQQQDYFEREKEYFRQKPQRNIKNLCTKRKVTVNLR